MSTIGRTLEIRGELRAEEDLTIEGRVEGPIFCESGAVTIAASGCVSGDVIARDITVFGQSAGRLIATDVVDLRPDADVRAHILARRFILDPAAKFAGRVEPQHLEAALRVAKFEQRKRDGASPSPATAGAHPA
jgi:cytoskeletal protein CcmA (bactofilin family)